MPPNLATLLAKRSEFPLPDREAQSRFEPELSYGRHFDPLEESLRPAAVLALLYPIDGQWYLPMTLRPVHMLDHAGQVSLPGGMVESGESSVAAARREFIEEMGVDPTGLKILGSLTPINLYSTRFAITPWLACVEERPPMNPNQDEVAAVLETPIAELLNRANYGRHVIRRGGLRFFASHIAIQGHLIWGATALILGEIIALLEQVAQENEG